MTHTWMIEEAITAHWGDPCPDYVEGCPICDAWAQFDTLVEAAKEWKPANPAKGLDWLS